MPDRAIAPLEELARNWRERAAYYDPHARHSDMSAAKEDAIEECADELSSLLPALASRFEALEGQLAEAQRNANDTSMVIPRRPRIGN